MEIKEKYKRVLQEYGLKHLQQITVESPTYGYTCLATVVGCSTLYPDVLIVAQDSFGFDFVDPSIEYVPVDWKKYGKKVDYITTSNIII